MRWVEPHGQKFEDIAVSLDLSKRSSSPRMDEFGRAAVAFDKLMRRVEATVSAVNVSTESVATATREIAAGNLDLPRARKNRPRRWSRPPPA